MFRQTVKSRAEIVHAHAYGYFPTFAATLGSALEGCALVITPHSDAGRPSWSKSLFDKVVPRLTLQKASRVIAVTRHEAAHLRHVRHAQEEIARVVVLGDRLERLDVL